MPDTRMTVEVAGTPLTREQIEHELVDVQVEEATDEADAALLSATLRSDQRGGWSSVLDPLTTPKTKVAVELRRGMTSYRFEGCSTQATWHVAAGGESQLTVKAVDRTVEMNDEEKVVAWRASDSGIADQILSSHGFTTEVTATTDQPDADVNVVMQRATDWAFLKGLAAKWGYAVYLEARPGRVVGVFGPLDPLAMPQAELSFGFGGDAARMSVAGDLLAGRDVSAARLKALSTSVLKGSDPGTGDAQASRSLGGQTTVLLSPADVAGEIDPTEAAKGLARRTAFALRLEAELDPVRVEPLVRARRTISVGGAGDALSGTYLVDRVRHRVALDRHVQTVTLVRNALSSGGPPL
jgi:hypothetical protein